MKTSDELDVGEMAVDDTRQYFIENLRRYRPSLPATGECLYCGNALAPGERWCDAECRDEWERAHVARGIKS